MAWLGVKRCVSAHTCSTHSCVHTFTPTLVWLQVWSGSRDKRIKAHDATSLTTAFDLGDVPGSGVKQLISHTWFVW